MDSGETQIARATGRPRVGRHLLAATLLLALAAPAAHAAYPGTNGDIAFSTDPANEDQEIVTLDGDVLTNNSADDRTPVYSPDGTKIAFVSTRDGNEEIYVMDADGTDQRRLTNNPYPDRDPTWSPRGRRIAYMSTVASRVDIWARNADGTCPARQLTEDLGADTDPAWSPDGTTIAFETPRDGNADIWAMDADGTDERNLTNTLPGVSSLDPSWSPDSASIAFTRAMGNTEVFTMDADGDNQTNRTNAGVADVGPTFSPDGTQLAWSTNRDGNAEIYTATVAGASTPTRGTNRTALDERPDWQAAVPAAPTVTDAPYTCPPPQPPVTDDPPDPPSVDPPAGPTGQQNTTTTTTITPTVIGTTPPARTSGLPMVTLVRNQTLRRALARGYAVRAGCAQACRLTGRLVVSRSLARRLRLSRKARSVTVARGSVSAPAGKRARMTLKFTRTAKRRLARARSVKLTLVLKPAQGTSRSRSITLKR